MANNNQGIYNNIDTNQPEVIYCTSSEKSVVGLVNVLQQIHNSLLLDYSKINIIGKANLFKDDFVQSEIVQPLAAQNSYLTLQTIEESKPVNCCNHFQKKLLRSARPLLIILILWTIALALSYFITLKSGSNSLGIIVQVFQIIYFSIEAMLIYFGISKFSISLLQILSVMSSNCIFVSLVVMLASMFASIFQLDGFDLKGYIVALVLNAMNMFFTTSKSSYCQNLTQGLKRICAVVKQITSVELVE